MFLPQSLALLTNILIDIILLAVPVWTVISYTKNGFVRSILRSGRFVMSVIIACLMAPTVGNYMAGSSVYDGVKSFVNENLGDSLGNIDASGIDALAVLVCKVIAFVAIFFAANILINLLAFILDKLFRLPILKQVNTFAGFCFGVALGIVNLFVISSVISLMLNYGIISGGATIAENTVVYKFIAEIDLASVFIFILNGLK